MSSYDVDYDELYRGSAAGGGPPWDIGAPQPALARVLDDVPPGASVLDIGCGQGDLAIALARRGHDVTGVDISPVGIEVARARAAHAGVTVRFEVQDATALSLPAAPFGAVFDSGLLHSLDRRDDGSADTYLASLPGLAAPGAPVFVLAISAAAGDGWRLTADALRASSESGAPGGEILDACCRYSSYRRPRSPFPVRAARTSDCRARAAAPG